MQTHNRDRGAGAGFIERRFDVNATLVNRQPKIKVELVTVTISFSSLLHLVNHSARFDMLVQQFRERLLVAELFDWLRCNAAQR